MTLGQQEQKLQDVLAVLEAARVPPVEGRAVSDILRGLLDRQTELDRLFSEMSRDLTDVVGLLSTLDPENDEQTRAQARMLAHLRGDLARLEATQRAVQQAADVMYVGFYALL
ncbi:hypothetical protein [Deinococcus sp. Leaf326]|uniref:hypothetical protein n=1 Tax=Deinococcus sp. Leaf326 TaxID=1736338 RepID=UPI0006FA4528|nr:hypothetical protein [Deinococcus sp. Leaf326]KQR41151.1 hypothetical protein ASF71_03280 [Deinococcus sp. Leaf326]